MEQELGYYYYYFFVSKTKRTEKRKNGTVMVIDMTKINQMHLFNREKDDHAFMENPEYVSGTWEKSSKPTTTTNK